MHASIITTEAKQCLAFLAPIKILVVLKINATSYWTNKNNYSVNVCIFSKAKIFV